MLNIFFVVSVCHMVLQCRSFWSYCSVIFKFFFHSNNVTGKFVFIFSSVQICSSLKFFIYRRTHFVLCVLINRSVVFLMPSAWMNNAPSVYRETLHPADAKELFAIWIATLFNSPGVFSLPPLPPLPSRFFSLSPFPLCSLTASPSLFSGQQQQQQRWIESGLRLITWWVPLVFYSQNKLAVCFAPFLQCLITRILCSPLAARPPVQLWDQEDIPHVVSLLSLSL